MPDHSANGRHNGIYAFGIAARTVAHIAPNIFLSAFLGTIGQLFKISKLFPPVADGIQHTSALEIGRWCGSDPIEIHIRIISGDTKA